MSLQPQILFLFAIIVLSTGCVSSASKDYVVTDPLESINRQSHQINSVIDNNVINPVLSAYRWLIPKPLRQGFNNALLNFRTIDSVANGLLQGNIKSAWIDTQRILLNSTLGIGGIFDIAKHEGLEFQDEDFGQTLAVWGVKQTPYLFIPLMGPTTLRDFPGEIWRRVIFYDITIIDDKILAFSSIEQRSRAQGLIQAVNDSSLDNYSALRNGFAQKRKDAILNGKIDDDDFFDILDESFDEDDE